MCYAIPALLIAIEGNIGIVDYFGEKRKILLDLEFEPVKVGDYIYAQGGVFVRKIAPKEAEEILAHWRNVFFELKKTDEALSRIDQDKLSSNALAILQKVNLQKTLKKSELLELFKLKAPEELSVLYEIANNVRQREHGNASCIHGIIEFSNYCSQNCCYCGIRADRVGLTRYRLEIEEILAIAKNAIDKYGFKAIVLQSGEDYWYDDAKLEKLVRNLRKMGVLVFVSLGLRSEETYRKLYKAGARAALMRFETSNEEIFSRIRPGTTLKDRLKLIRSLKDMGYVIATGFLVGLPGETDEDIVNNILLTKSLGPDMYSFGPFLPTIGTPMEKAERASKELILKTIAISRLVDYGSNILVTTALETLDKEAKREGLLAGANSMMINITPEKYRSLYAIYDNRASIDTVVSKAVQETVDLLYSLGRAPTDLGFISG
ncbi:MAG: radical SAM protein [Gammaproteobacteria bacterium]